MSLFPLGRILLVLALAFCPAACGNNEPPRLQIGDPAPDFVAQDLAGNAVTMSSLRGHPVILRFWTTDCKFCRADTPIFNASFTQHKEQGLKIIYVNTKSTMDEVRAFARELEIAFPVVLDQDGSITASYQVKLVPQTLIISPDQNIVANCYGGVGEEELQKLLEPYLKSPENSLTNSLGHTSQPGQPQGLLPGAVLAR